MIGRINIGHSLIPDIKGSHDFLSGIELSRPGYRFHIGLHNTLHRKSGRRRIVAGSLFVSVVRPVHPDGQRLFPLQSAAGKRECHMIHAVCHKIHRSRIDFLVADPDRYRDAAVSVISVPVVQTEPYRNAFKLFCRVRRDSQIKDGKVVVTLSPDRIKRSVPFLGINAACRPGRCGCFRVGAPTEKIVSVPCRYSGRQNQIVAIGLGHASGGVLAAVRMESNHIGVNFPDGTQRHAFVYRIVRSRLIIRLSGTVFAPTEEGITLARRNDRGKRQINVLGFGLRCRCAGTSVCGIADGVGFGNLLPNGVQRAADIGPVIISRQIHRRQCRRIGAPPTEHITASGRLRKRNRSSCGIPLDDAVRRTRAAIGIKGNRIGLFVPDRIQRPIAVCTQHTAGRIDHPSVSDGTPPFEGIAGTGRRDFGKRQIRKMLFGLRCRCSAAAVCVIRNLIGVLVIIDRLACGSVLKGSGHAGDGRCESGYGRRHHRITAPDFPCQHFGFGRSSAAVKIRIGNTDRACLDIIHGITGASLPHIVGCRKALFHSAVRNGGIVVVFQKIP